jgi:hypothetical protein
MAKPRRTWEPAENEPIRKLAENLRWVRAPIPGVALNRTMTVARLDDGRLVIWSAIALSEPSMQELEAWGTPAFLIVPSALHRLDAVAYKARYPGLKVLAPSGARKAVEALMPLDGLLQDFPSDERVSFAPLAGIQDKEGAMLVRSNDGTSVVLNDALFNMPMPQPMMVSLLVKAMGSAPGPRVSRVVKLLWCDDRAAFRGSLATLAQVSDLTRVIVAHDSIAEGAAAREALLAAVEQLA